MEAGPGRNPLPPASGRPNLPSRLRYRMHTSRFEVRPVRPLARPCRAPRPFRHPREGGVHPWLPMPPQPVESKLNR